MKRDCEPGGGPDVKSSIFHLKKGSAFTLSLANIRLSWVSENSCKFFLHLGHKAGTRKGAAWWLGSLLHPNRKKRWAGRRQYRRSSRKCSCLRLTLPSPIPAPVTCPRCCWDLLCRQQIENGLLKFVSFITLWLLLVSSFFFFFLISLYISSHFSPSTLVRIG